MIGRDRSLLFSTHTKPDYMPPPAYGPRMLVCGPHFPLSVPMPGGATLNVAVRPHTPYDLAEMIQRLPAERRPDMLVARIDAYFENSPVNLRNVKVPRVAIVGDTHHMKRPLTRMLRYLLREPYDFYVLDHNLQHAHWYMESGIRNIVWLPAILLADDFRKPRDSTEERLSFVGTTGPIHPIRTQLIEKLRQSSLPFHQASAPQKGAFDIYNRSRLSLNISLNGDFNLRVFEVLAAGGCLLTDRLDRTSGIDRVFEEGRDYLAYGCEEELEEIAARYLADESARHEIARNGHEAVRRQFSLDRRAEMFTQLAFEGKLLKKFLPDDPRIRAYGCKSRADLMFRIGLYEWMQEQHRVTPCIRVLATAGADPRVICDMSDLPRLDLVQQPSLEAQRLIAACDLERRIHIAADDEALRAARPDVVACRSGEVLDFPGDQAPGAVLLTDCSELDERRLGLVASTLGQMGLRPHREIRGVFLDRKRWSAAAF